MPPSADLRRINIMPPRDLSDARSRLVRLGQNPSFESSDQRLRRSKPETISKRVMLDHSIWT
jgi:hypothetical protein